MANNYIKDFRKRFGWSQKRLSEESGVSVNAIRNWESGRTSPPLWVGFVFRAIIEQFPPYRGYKDNNDSK